MNFYCYLALVYVINELTLTHPSKKIVYVFSHGQDNNFSFKWDFLGAKTLVFLTGKNRFLRFSIPKLFIAHA